MTALRTPESRFENLPDYAFAPHYAEVGDGLRLHYLDEGPESGEGRPVLMMHGEPSWSYLYRHMIPPVAERARVLAPDLVGFGKSDKLPNKTDYSYAKHVAWMSEWLEAMDLRDVLLVCQDWGGLIGLRLVAAYPERFAGVVAANTMLPVGDGHAPEAFRRWQAFSQTVEDMPVGQMIQSGTTRELLPQEVAAYDAPFPDARYKAGAHIFPSLVPTEADDPENPAQKRAWESLSRFDKPFVTAFSDSDPITGGGDKIFQSKVPGTQGQPHKVLKGGHHFLQEDVPGELVEVVLDLLERLDA